MISASIILAVAAAALFAAYRLGCLNGIKTQAMLVLGALATVASAIDPGLLSTALGLDAQGRAIVQIGFIGLAIVAKSMSTKPGTLGRLRQNRGR